MNSNQHSMNLKDILSFERELSINPLLLTDEEYEIYRRLASDADKLLFINGGLEGFIRVKLEACLTRYSQREKRLNAMKDTIERMLTQSDIQAWHSGQLTRVTRVITDKLSEYDYEMQIYGSKSDNAIEPLSVVIR